MENRLISMTDFVFYLDELNGGLGEKETGQIFEYAKFLKQPLTLGMFIPVDENGNVLNEPNEDDSKFYPTANNGYFDIIMFNDDVELYEEAKERVLFKGFNFLESWGEFWHLMHESGNNLLIRKDGTTTIEKQLLAQPFEIELTESALKQIELKTN